MERVRLPLIINIIQLNWSVDIAGSIALFDRLPNCAVMLNECIEICQKRTWTITRRRHRSAVSNVVLHCDDIK